MKKLLALTAALTMCLSFAACGEVEDDSSEKPAQIALSMIGCDKGDENIQEPSSTGQTTTKSAPREWTSTEDADQMAYYIYMLASGISLDAKNREISVSEDFYKHDDESEFVAELLISLDEFETDIICPADLTFEIAMGAGSPMSVKCEGMGFSGEYPVSE